MIILFALLIAAILAGCSGPVETVLLSGHTESKTITINTFRELTVNHAVEVIICDTVTEPRIETDSALLDRMRIVQVGNKLTIGFPGGLTWAGDSHSRVWIPADRAEMETIRLSGASVLHVDEPISCKSTDIALSGASVLYASLHVHSGRFNLSGSSHAYLEGDAENIRMNLSGSSMLHSEKSGGRYLLDATALEGHLSGACMVYVHSDGQINANLSGASAIFFTGTADTRDCTCSDVCMLIRENE